MPQRLPIVNQDDGQWGTIIRQFLMKEHANDDTDNPLNGQHQNITIKASTGASGTAPITFNSGPTLTTPAAGAMEFNTDSLYFTITTGTTRKKVAIYDDSAGVTGDLHYRDASGNFVRLGAGSSGQVLKVASGLPAWGNNATGFSTSTKTGSYNVGATDTVILGDASSGSIQLTLPLASSTNGYRFYIKRIDAVTANFCRVACNGSDTIDGQSYVNLDVQYMSIAVVSNGSAWYIL